MIRCTSVGQTSGQRYSRNRRSGICRRSRTSAPSCRRLSISVNGPPIAAPASGGLGGSGCCADRASSAASSRAASARARSDSRRAIRLGHGAAVHALLTRLPQGAIASAHASRKAGERHGGNGRSRIAAIIAACDRRRRCLPLAPASAQIIPTGYKFLKAVKEKDGDKVTEALNEPGSTVINTRDITTGETALHIVTAAARSDCGCGSCSARAPIRISRDNKGVTPLRSGDTSRLRRRRRGADRQGGARIDVANDRPARRR